MFTRVSHRIFLPTIFTLLTCFIFWSPISSVAAEKKLSDEELLDTIQRNTFDYFVHEMHPNTGLVYDRASNVRGETRQPASIAATGFALTAYGVGVERGWMTHREAYRRTLQTLKFFKEHAASEHGFFYHFLNAETGERARNSELSPIDTALFLAGALFASEYFEDDVITALASHLYSAVDWEWMLHGGETFAKSWTPEDGFSKWRWGHYDESLIMYLLAIGSLTHPIPVESWQAIKRPVGSYKDYRLIMSPPLFTHQYSHAWIDFRGRNDGFADYFKNSVQASLANRQFVIDHAGQYEGYGPKAWGLTASDGPWGYKAYGAPPGWAEHDGTLAPTGCGSSIPFTPKESLDCLRHYYEKFQDKIWGRYGFASAFNVSKNWYSTETIGIDQGALLLMIENYRSELIWDVMRQNHRLKAAMEEVGFELGSMELSWSEPASFDIPYMLSGSLAIDGYLKDWPNGPALILDPSHREVGSFKDAQDAKAEFRFAWDEAALYFFAKVTDDSVLLKRKGQNIWRDDLVEIFVDPKGDGLTWKSRADFQIGFRPNFKEGDVEVWSWFQGGEDPSQNGRVRAQGFAHKTGYIVEGEIRWSYLGIFPQKGMTLHISPAIHDIDQDRSGGKLQWFFRSEGDLHEFSLGEMVLKAPNI